MKNFGKTMLKVGVGAGMIGIAAATGKAMAKGAFWLMDKIDGVGSKEEEPTEEEVVEETTEEKEAE